MNAALNDWLTKTQDELNRLPAGRAYAMLDRIRALEEECARLPRWHRGRRRRQMAIKTMTRNMRRYDPAAWVVYIYAGALDFVDDGMLTSILFTRGRYVERSKYRYG